MDTCGALLDVSKVDIGLVSPTRFAFVNDCRVLLNIAEVDVGLVSSSSVRLPKFNTCRVSVNFTFL
jgi:hypothetical protein